MNSYCFLSFVALVNFIICQMYLFGLSTYLLHLGLSKIDETKCRMGKKSRESVRPKKRRKIELKKKENIELFCKFNHEYIFVDSLVAKPNEIYIHV